MSEEVKNNNVHRGYLGGGVGAPALKRAAPEFKVYETGYSQSGFYAGYDRLFLRNSGEGGWLSEGSLRLQADYYYVGGDEGNLGSHKHQYNLLTGWKQRFSPLVFLESDLPFHLFLDPMTGFGVADNALNFGRGFPLEEETSFNLLARFGGGAEYCFQPIVCLGFKGDYGMERSLAGIDYFQKGWRIVSEAEVHFGAPPAQGSDTCWQELNKVRGYLSTCETKRNIIYEELVGLHRQTQEILADNVTLKETIGQQIYEHQKECMESDIVLPNFEREIVPLESHPSWERMAGECQDQLKAARKSLKECLGSRDANERKDQLSKQLTQTRQIHQRLVHQLDAVIRWVHECRKATLFRTPKAMLLFVNDNADIPTRQQRFFGQSRGQVNSDLDDWMIYLNRPENQNVKVRIHGYANDTGDPKHNLALSKTRAENVKHYLVRNERSPSALYGPTLLPAEEVPPEKRIKCIQDPKQTEWSSSYCPIHMDPKRVVSSEGYGSDPQIIEKLQGKLKDFGIVVTEADTQHSFYRMVWIEVSDRDGNFKND